MFFLLKRATDLSRWVFDSFATKKKSSFSWLVDDGSAPPNGSSSLITAVKAIVLIVIFVLPIAFIPFAQNSLYIKTTLVEVGAVLAGVLWLVNSLFARRLTYKRSPVNLFFLASALALVLATVFSKAPWSSFWGADVTGEKTATTLAFFIISFVVGAVFSREDVRRAVKTALSSFTLLGLFALFTILASRFGWQLPQWIGVNPVGTTNALAYILSIGFLLALCTRLFGRDDDGVEKSWLSLNRLALAASLVIFPAIVLTAFRIVWVGVFVTLATALALVLVKPRAPRGARLPEEQDGARKGVGQTAVALMFLILAVSLFLVFSPLPFASKVFQPPTEIAPSAQSTLMIGWQVIKSRPVFGLGPDNFRLAFNLFHDQALNNTPFWAVRFNHGFSFLTTLISTLGLAGLLVFLAMIVGIVFAVGRALWRAGGDSPLLMALAAASFFVVVEWFIYASNLVASFFFFLFVGLLTALVAAPGETAGGAGGRGSASGRDKSWWRLGLRSVIFDSPAVNFSASLVIVFIAAFSVVALYALAAQYAADIYSGRAAMVFNLYGNTDTAKVFYDKAIDLDPTEESYYRGKTQIELVVLNKILGRAAGDNAGDLSGQFRAELTQAVNAAQKARDLGPDDPQNWILLGQIYEMVMPYISGADRSALDSYEKAGQLDPLNPIYPLAKARVYLTAGDILTLQIGQTSSGNERGRLEAIREEIWAKSAEELKKSAALKSDFADAHYLLAQLSIRKGNVKAAIANTEDTLSLAPNDIGVVFQLGVLYYRAGDLDKAKAAFERAIILNDNYSNARYFLGLIWDKKGDRDAALSQFQKIAALNPGNDEVERIMANLTAGRPALKDIVPPAPAPESRKEVPVKEERSRNSPKPAGSR